MERKEGIFSALDHSVSLEGKIAYELREVLLDDTITSRYIDPHDKQNVMYRELIVKVLETIYEHNLEKHQRDEDGVMVQISDELDPFVELFSAFRSLRHDIQRLNEGLEAERVAKPVIQESITGKNIIPMDRKLRILWYAASDLYCKADRDLFETQSALEEHAAKILRSTQKSLKTGRSQLKSTGNATEQEFFYTCLKDCKQRSEESGGQVSPLKLLLPALRALSRD